MFVPKDLFLSRKEVDNEQSANHYSLRQCTMGCLRSLMTPYQNILRIRYGAITNDSVFANEQYGVILKDALIRYGVIMNYSEFDTE